MVKIILCWNPNPVSVSPIEILWVKLGLGSQLSFKLMELRKLGIMYWQSLFKGTLGLLGQISKGGVLSTTSIRNEQEEEFPLESAAETVINVALPTASGVPAVGFWLKI